MMDIDTVVAFIENEDRLGRSPSLIIAAMRFKGLVPSFNSSNPFSSDRMLAEGLRRVQLKRLPAPAPAPKPGSAPALVPTGRPSKVVVGSVVVGLLAAAVGGVVYVRRRRMERYA
jgi:hypothetical protein